MRRNGPRRALGTLQNAEPAGSKRSKNTATSRLVFRLLWSIATLATQHNSRKPFTVAYGCARLGISVPTFYDLVNSGKLRTYKIGRARRVSEDALNDCIKLLEAETAQGAAS